jgi:hypothetical protein
MIIIDNKDPSLFLVIKYHQDSLSHSLPPRVLSVASLSFWVCAIQSDVEVLITRAISRLVGWLVKGVEEKVERRKDKGRKLYCKRNDWGQSCNYIGGGGRGYRGTCACGGSHNEPDAPPSPGVCILTTTTLFFFKLIYTWYSSMTR